MNGTSRSRTGEPSAAVALLSPGLPSMPRVDGREAEGRDSQQVFEPQLTASLDWFWAQVEVVGECWEWKGQRNVKGYGSVKVAGKSLLAHRLSYLLYVGRLTPGHSVCHRCDNPPCVRPDHLFAGTAKDNVEDMIRKGRNEAIRGERVHSARLTADQVLEIRREAARGVPRRELGLRFGVSHGTISEIVTRRKWKHI
jgi:hypothetical protein